MTTLPDRLRAYRAMLPCAHCAGQGTKVTVRHPQGAACAVCGGSGKYGTQADLARLLGVSKDTISHWEQGVKRPVGLAAKALEQQLTTKERRDNGPEV